MSGTTSASQVHKAVLKEGGRSRSVAVKVRHPGVARRIKQDFQLLIPLARATSRFKALKVRECCAMGRCRPIAVAVGRGCQS